MLCARRWLQEEFEEEREILSHGRSERDEHGGKQLVCLQQLDNTSAAADSLPIRIHKAKYDEDEKSSPTKDRKKARSKSRGRTMFGLKS